MQHHFQSIDQTLYESQKYWRFEPFFTSSNAELPWASINPQLCDYLQSLQPNDIERLKCDHRALVEALSPFIPQVSVLDSLNSLPQLSYQGLTLGRGIDVGVPGRKLDQILSMGEAALTHHKGDEWLEWCSGKGFLGRILASKSQQKVTSLEYQTALCSSGQIEADKQQLAMEFVQGDALSDTVNQVFNHSQHAVALHACGDLHVSLLTKGVAHRLPAMTISPCCYHLIQDESYSALSTQAKASKIHLTKTELRIPLQETVTGGERVKRHRTQEMSYRLGYDLLLREVCGFTSYQPTPSIKKSQLSAGFAAFCIWASEIKNITLPQVDFDHFEQLGCARFWHMERLSLVQQLFRRSLELWLALDKGLYLEQNGYQVQINQFCSRESTPRNILIHAERA